MGKRSFNFLMIFLSALVIFFLFLISLIFRRSALLDSFVSMGFFAALVYIHKKNNITPSAFLLAFFAILTNLLGVMWVYSHFVVGIIGYDKLVHFVSGFAAAYLLLQIISEKRKFLRYSFVVLIVLGLGSLVEINEFIGTRYFGINNGGIFAISDALPAVKSDLQRYDTYFDMIFNFVGSLSCIILLGLNKKSKIIGN